MSANPVMKVLILSIIALALAVGDSYAFRNMNEGDPVPGFKLKDASGKDVSLADFTGKVVVVTFFKGDQDNSLKAVAGLQKVHEKYGAKGAQMLAITPDKDDGSSAASVAAKYKLTYPVLVDEGRAVYGSWGVFLFPTTAVIGKDGKLFKHLPSYDRKYGENVEGYVRLALGEITAGELDALLNPEDKARLSPEQKKAERHMMLGQRMVDRKLLDKAAGEYKEAVESDPELVDAHVKYGFVLLKLEKPAEAKGEFDKAMELNAKAEDAAAGLGAALVALGELDKGIEVLEGALKLNPKPARAHYELGRAYEKKGAPDKAAEHYRKTIEELGGALW